MHFKEINIKNSLQLLFRLFHKIKKKIIEIKNILIDEKNYQNFGVLFH